MISQRKMLYQAIFILTMTTGCADSEEPTPPTDAGDRPDAADPDSGGDTVLDSASADSDNDADAGDHAEAEFEVSTSMSRTIPTVGIVEWAVDKDPLIRATIEFGRDGAVEYEAPVDLEAKNFRTVLLGMKPSSTYKFRIVAEDKNGVYRSRTYPIRTGDVPTALPSINRSGNQTGLAGGFMITCSFSSGWAFILDKDGDYVWWYQPLGGTDGVRAKMSYDGRDMIIANGNVPGPNDGTMSMVRIDGSDERTFDVPLRHHDVEVLPDGTLVYIEYENSGVGTCDRVMEMLPNGDTNPIFVVRDYFGDDATDGEWCHSNAINYIPEEDAFTLSILHMDAILKFKRTGELVWIFGGKDSDFEGVSWDSQHQHQWLGDSLLIFNNVGNVYDGSFGGISRIIEYSVDERHFESSLIWEYSADNLKSFSMGDTKRLPNGNTLVVYSTAGKIHEVSPAKEPLRVLSFLGAGLVGYVEWRESLYGPPQAYLNND